MKKLLLLVLFFSTPYHVKAEEKCPNLAGLWSTHDSSDVSYYRQEIAQKKCESLIITTYTPNNHSVERIAFTVNDVWKCEKGTSERLECHKAKWAANNVLITRVSFEEGCLSVAESYLENEDTLRTDTKASCRVDVEGFGYGSSWVRRVVNR